NTPAPVAPPTLTPTANVVGLGTIAPTNTIAAQGTAIGQIVSPTETPPSATATQANNVAQPAASPAAVAPVTVPPISFATVMTPQRLFWLFIIGLVVFTVTYVLQVMIWYRIKK
ncbi:MAG: hypothetical protein R3264_14540, partial [Anaerolineae bacterium]|nr:hypothetical protein [Anaerolineae bacterium]